MAMRYTSVKQIIDLWPSRAALAGAIRSSEGAVPLDRVHKWAQTGSIPARYWAALISSARAQGFVLTADDLVAVHDVRAAG